MPVNLIPDQSANVNQMLDGNYLHGETAGGQPYLKETFEAIINNTNLISSESNVTPGASKVGVQTNAYTNFLKATNDVAAALAGIDAELGTLSSVAGGSASLIDIAEDRSNVGKIGVNKTGSTPMITNDYTYGYVSLGISGAVSIGANSFVVTNTNNIYNIPSPGIGIIYDKAAGGKQELCYIQSVTYGSGTISITLSTSLINGYGAGTSYFGTSSGKITTNTYGLQNTTDGMAATAAAYLAAISVDTIYNKMAWVGKKIKWSAEISQKSWAVSSFDSINQTKLSAVSGEEAAIKNGDVVVLYKYFKDGSLPVSPYSEVLQSNHALLAITGAATYSGSDMTIVHGNNLIYGSSEANETYNDLGVTRKSWRVARVALVAQYSIRGIASGVSLSPLTISSFDVNKTFSLFYNEDFSGTLAYSNAAQTRTYNGWSVRSEIYQGTGIDNGNARMYGENANAWWFRNAENITILDVPLDIVGRYYESAASPRSKGLGIAGNQAGVNGTALSNPTNGPAWWHSSNTLYLGDSSGTLISAADSLTGATWYNYRFRIEKYFIAIKLWVATSSEPSAWTLSFVKSTPLTGLGNYLGFYSRSDSASQTNYEIRYDDINVYKLGGHIYGAEGVSSSGEVATLITTISTNTQTYDLPKIITNRAVVM